MKRWGFTAALVLMSGCWRELPMCPEFLPATKPCDGCAARVSVRSEFDL